MFKKLRNEFLILNITIISILMICAFTFIYLITYNSIRLENQNKLRSSEQGGRTQLIRRSPDGYDEVITHTTQRSSFLFSITVNTDGDILNINSILDMEHKSYESAVETAWNNKDGGTLVIEGRKWQYALNPKVEIKVIGRENRMLKVADSSFDIVFLDITESEKTLFKLLITLIIVGIVSLFVIFFISMYFANRAIKPISQAWEKQKQFIADASHELKTPLAIINANYDAILSNQGKTIESQLKWFEYMRIGSDRMLQLINELLNMAKIEEINYKIPKSMFNISVVASDTISSMESAAVKRGIELLMQIEPDIMIKGHSEGVKQVIEILFDNAIRYANDNGKIDIFLTKSKKQISFSISNSGIGIAAEDLPKVFDRFYRADPARTKENNGYGLGLSIAKSTTERMGGNIYVKSVENENTTFVFIIPTVL